MLGLGTLSTRKGRDGMGGEGGGGSGDDTPYGGTWLVSNGDNDQQPDSIEARDTLFLRELKAKAQVHEGRTVSGSGRRPSAWACSAGGLSLVLFGVPLRFARYALEDPRVSVDRVHCARRRHPVVLVLPRHFSESHSSVRCIAGRCRGLVVARGKWVVHSDYLPVSAFVRARGSGSYWCFVREDPSYRYG